MRKTIFHLIILSSIIFLFFMSIRQKKNANIHEQLLRQAEFLMDKKPDSALSVLNSLPSPQKLKANQQALYALLFTQAQYKNYIPVTNDSLIKIAEQYYQNNPDSTHKAWTYFYAGQYYRSSPNIEKSLKYFQKADRASSISINHHFKSLLFYHWGYLLSDKQLYDKAIKKFQEAEKHAILCQDTNLLIPIIQESCWCYLVKQDYEKAEKTALQVLTIAHAFKKEQVEARAMHDLSIIHQKQNHYLAALQWINQSIKVQTDSNSLFSTYLTKADILLDLCHYDSALYYLKKDIRNNSLIIKAGQYKLWAKYEEKTKNYPQAIFHLKRYAEVADSLHEKTENENLAEIQQRYDYSIVEGENKILHFHQKLLRIQTLLACAMLAIGIFVVYKVYSRKQKETEKLLQSREELMTQLQLQLQEKALNLQEIREKIKQNEEVLQQHSDSEQQMRDQILQTCRISKRVKELNEMSQKEKIKSFAPLSDEELQSLTETANICYNNFAERLRLQFPTLSDTDLHLCNLIRMGIPQETILYLLNTNKTALKKRKTRLKREKMNLDEDASFDDFLMAY